MNVKKLNADDVIEFPCGAVLKVIRVSEFGVLFTLDGDEIAIRPESAPMVRKLMDRLEATYKK